jgi:hypothetical protein
MERKNANIDKMSSIIVHVVCRTLYEHRHLKFKQQKWNCTLLNVYKMSSIYKNKTLICWQTNLESIFTRDIWNTYFQQKFEFFVKYTRGYYVRISKNFDFQIWFFYLSCSCPYIHTILWKQLGYAGICNDN